MTTQNFTPRETPHDGTAQQPGAKQPGAGQPGAGRAKRSTASTAILVTTAVVGGFALLGAAASAAFGLRVADSWGEQIDSSYSTTYADPDAGSSAELYADAFDVTSINIEAAASDFRIKYADDTEEAVLTVQHAQQVDADVVNGWTMERDGDELNIARNGGGWGADGCLFGCSTRPGESQIVTLTLPKDLGLERAASLDVTVEAGSFTGTGSFDELDLELNAGELTFTGDARSVDVDVEVGTARAEVADVEAATVTVATGEATVKLTGTAPASTEVEAEMGSVTLQLPTETYRVETNAELGGVDNRLKVSKDSKYLVTVEASLADVVLK
ncbi:DUF4097 family beta strand repeat-containing protein [Leucobacter sp. HY1908]